MSQTKTPATQLPTNMMGSACCKRILNSPAIIEPVHTPVVGSGIATKMNKNHARYFSTLPPRRSSRSCCQFPKRLKSLTLLFINQLRTRRVSRIINGENIIEPNTATIKHSISGIPRLKPSGIAPFSSIMGTAANPKTAR